MASVAGCPKSNRSPGSRKTTSSSSTSRNAGSGPCEAWTANALSAARKAARSSRRSRCASGLALHVRARSSPSMALGRLSGEPTHGVQRCPPMSGGDRYASTNAITVRRTVVGATGGLASRDGERPARSVQRRRDRCHHHDHGSGVEGAARHGPRRARADCSGPAHLRLELRVCRHLLEQSPPHATRRPAHRRARPLGEPAPALLALARAVHHRLGRRVSQGRRPDRGLRGSVFDGRCRVVAAAGCAGEAKRTGVAARACRRAGPEGEAIGGALRSEEHTSELQSLTNLVCRLLLEKKKKKKNKSTQDKKKRILKNQE